MTLLKLFLAFLQVGLFTIGGGTQLGDSGTGGGDVRMAHWGRIYDLITISQMTPAPIGINAATFVGTTPDCPAHLATVGRIRPPASSC